MKLVEAKHGLMLINPLDIYIGRSFDLYEEFSEGEVEMFDALLTAESVALDVGANIGAHTVPMAKKARFVVAIEPQRLIFQTLCANIALNRLKNVQALHAAVGAESGVVSLPVLDPDQENNFGGYSIPVMANHDVPSDQVAIVPIDSMEFARVDFMKIDVEGMELEVLKGATKTIQEHRLVLYVKNDRKENSEALKAYIKELGYEMKEHNPPLFNPENHAGNSENGFEKIVSINLACYPR